jgi:ABC-type branched-subunit amino acid transport system permease subunit
VVAIVVLLAVHRGRPSRALWVLAALAALLELAEYMGVALAHYQMVLYSLALILMMILRPQGIFGIHEVWDLPRLWRIGRGAAPKPGATKPGAAA